jgi:putative membrane protein
MTADDLARLERPHPSLLTVYVVRSILTGPGVVVALPLLICRYITLRYRFDDAGIHARWGVLFRREVNLTYSRIQDIHLHSGIVQRWLGLADVQIQTASGSATPELVIEGFKEFEAIRDFLYTRMRGYRRAGEGAAAGATSGSSDAGATDEALVSALRAVADELRATRAAIESLKPPGQ